MILRGDERNDAVVRIRGRNRFRVERHMTVSDEQALDYDSIIRLHGFCNARTSIAFGNPKTVLGEPQTPKFREQDSVENRETNIS